MQTCEPESKLEPDWRSKWEEAFKLTPFGTERFVQLCIFKIGAEATETTYKNGCPLLDDEG
jgi:hypothetical protein